MKSGQVAPGRKGGQDRLGWIRWKMPDPTNFSSLRKTQHVEPNEPPLSENNSRQASISLKKIFCPPRLRSQGYRHSPGISWCLMGQHVRT